MATKSWGLTALRIFSVLATLTIGALAACPLYGQQPVTGPQFKATLKVSVCDSIPRIGANGGNARLRDRLATRCTGLLAVPLKVDTVTVFVPVVDTVYLPLPPDTLTPPVGDTVIPIPPDPPTGEQFADTLSGVMTGDVLVPDGQSYLVGALEIRGGSLRTVSGTIAFRDGSRLRLTGCDPNAYVGGGMYWTPELAKDCGVWVGGPNATGKLDVRCTHKTAWAYAPPSDWSTTDELWITPTDVGDFVARRWGIGQPIPRAGPLVPSAELLNVTRSCSIEGTGHIHIHSQAPQNIENIALKGLGISNLNGPVLGRYVLHMHMSGEGSRGSVVRGVVATDSRGHVFVPHSSHGVTMLDNVSLNSWGAGMWWDAGHATNDLLIDRMLVAGVRMPDSIAGDRFPAFALHGGTNMEIRNSVAVGVTGGYTVAGFDWPEPTTPFQPVVDKLHWEFNVNNVAHNNRGPGVRFWTNNQDLHDVSNFATYRNAIAGIENGAYFSATQYHNVLSFEDGYQFGGGVSDAAGFFNNASATVNPNGVMQLTDCNITSKDGPAMKVGHRQLPATHRFLVQDCVFTSNGDPRTIGVPMDAWPKVWVHLGTNPWLAHFVRTNVLPEDIVFENDPGNNGSSVWIDHADGRRWDVRYENGQKVVTVRP